MQRELLPPFPGPIPSAIPNPIGAASVLGAFALAGAGIGFGIAGHRKLQARVRLLCESLPTDAGVVPLVGVPAGYQGDWWSDRGRKLYWKARRAGAQSESQIAKAIIAADVGSTSPCLAQFPPHAGTHERNRGFWDSLVEHVRRQMAAE